MYPSRDLGVRMLKIDTSNMKNVYYAPDAMAQSQLELHTDNIHKDRSPEDLLFQVLLDWGVDLSLAIEQETIDGKTVFFVDNNALAACFDPKISENLVKMLAARRPLRVVFRDSGYESDSTKINVEQIFRMFSPETEVRSL
jgi:adenine-specific DNA-methyltransferase